jgi:sugar lactone lactonase YvrE
MRPLLFLLLATVGNAQQIVTIAGISPSHRADVDGRNALDTSLGNVYALLRDRLTGRLLLHDENVVERVEPDGTLLAFAGVGRFSDGAIADGIPASNLAVNTMRGMAQDATGALYLADANAGRVYRIGLDGFVTTFAGAGMAQIIPGRDYDGLPAAGVPMGSPRGLAFDSKGNLLIAEVACQCIRRVDPQGILTTLYKLPGGGPYLYPEGLAIDAADNVYAAVYSGHTIIKITPDGSATTIAGTGVPGYSGDGGSAGAAQLNYPSGILIDPNGLLYITDTQNHRIRRIAADGSISTIAGTGSMGYSGDGGPAADARLSFPAQMLLNADGTIYFSDYGNRRVRSIAQDGTIVTIAGNGAIPSLEAVGDGGPAIAARLFMPVATAIDSAGKLYIADSTGYRVRAIAPDGTITTAAGNGNSLPSGDGGRATEASLGFVLGIGIDSQNNLYISSEDGRVRKVDANGIISLVAGAGPSSSPTRFQGDEGPAINATLNEPHGIAVDSAGNVYIADTSNARLRMVDLKGIIHFVAGASITALGKEYWNGVAIDGQGKIYVALTRTGSNSLYTLVARVNSDGTLTTIAGTGENCPDGNAFVYDGMPAVKVPLCIVIGLTFDSQGNLYIPEPHYGVLLKVTPDGVLSRVAGTSGATTLGDGGPALAARMNPPTVAVDAAGNLFLPQGTSSRVREITATPVTLKLSSNTIALQATQSQSLGVFTNYAEPFPYTVHLKTADGGNWLRANRTSGQTGEALQVFADPAGLTQGIYRGTATITLWLPTPQQADIAVTLTVK